MHVGGGGGWVVATRSLPDNCNCLADIIHIFTLSIGPYACNLCLIAIGLMNKSDQVCKTYNANNSNRCVPAGGDPAHQSMDSVRIFRVQPTVY